MIELNSFLKQVEHSDFRAWCQAICDTLRVVDSRYSWIGLYWLNSEALDLGPWSGDVATEHVHIPVSEGICGAAVREEKTIIVEDVHSDPRYLACFLTTRSEIVTPIYAEGMIIGEIDVDGKERDAFGEEDRLFFEQLADHIGKRWPGQW
jgi:L-methionine (R)-S-oxide reductase